MLTITQNKVAGLEPRWAAFPGFSLLFDNPGASTSPADDLLKIACPLQPGSELDFYFRLAETINDLDRDLLISTYLFCPLPPTSFHVTVWDGVNVDNESSVVPELRAEWTTFLTGIPESLHRPPASMSIVADSELMTKSFGNIRFQFEKLTIWGNQVLVSRLAPDEESKERFRSLSAARASLCDESKRHLGVAPIQSYSPHVSLGYFANREHGQVADARLADWTDRFRRNLDGSSITYSSLDVYAFTNMASFYKLAGTHLHEPASNSPHAP